MGKWILAILAIAPQSTAGAQDGLAKASAATVRIEAQSNGSTALGAGFHIGNGIVVTAKHVVDGRAAIRVTPAGSSTSHAAKPWRIGTTTDQAVLYTGIPRDTPAIELADTQPEIGSQVFTANPGGTKKHAISMLITRTELQGEIIENGESGSPLLNTDGKAIGVLFGRSSESSSAATMLIDLQRMLTEWTVAPRGIRTHNRQD